MSIHLLLQSLSAAVPAALNDEPSAIALFVRARWPNEVLPPCSRCRRAPTLRGAQLYCATCRRGPTVLVDTPLAHLRKPRICALLLALRAFAVDRRGLAARALASSLGVPRMTMWRHMHALRLLLPAVAGPRADHAETIVCGRSSPAQASITTGRRGARAALDRHVDMHPRRAPRSDFRLTGENTRAWLNGTHHGVTRRWLHRYVREAAARLALTPAQILRAALLPLGVSVS